MLGHCTQHRRPDPRPPRFRYDPFAHDVAFDPGRALSFDRIASAASPAWQHIGLATISQALAAMRDLDPAGVTYGSIRVDIAMSAISSAIHNTGHYHVRPRPVCLSRSCFRSAKNRHSRSSCVLASLDLATRDTRAAAKEPASRLQRSCAEPAARVLGLIFSDRSLAKGRAGMAGADRRSNDGKKKGRNYRDTLPISAIPNSNCSAATLGLRPG
jgi:hypothetical protein